MPFSYVYHPNTQWLQGCHTKINALTDTKVYGSLMNTIQDKAPYLKQDLHDSGSLILEVTEYTYYVQLSANTNIY